MRRTIFSLATLALLPFALFWRETLGRQVFYHHDLQYYFLPYHQLVADVTRRGWLPLWNPFAFSGIPLLADGQTAIFYPPNWLFWLLPPAHALSLSILLHFSLAGIGMCLYVRSLRLSYLAGVVAVLAFMFNGFLVAHVVHASIMAGAALIPLVLWSIERWLQRGGVGPLLVAAALVGIQALAGHPQIPIYTAVAAGIYVVVSLQPWRGSPVAFARRLGLFLVIYGLGYALVAAQLLPWIDFARFSPRAAAASYDLVAGQSVVGYDWLLLLFPYAFGGLETSWRQTLAAWDSLVYVWERLIYVGILPLALALTGLAELLPRRTNPGNATVALQRGRLWALATVLIVMLLITAGDSTPFGQVIYALPVIGKLRAYARAGALVCFALAALAAFGVDRLIRRSQETQRRRDWAAVSTGLIILGAVAAVLAVVNAVDSTTPNPPTDFWLRTLLTQGLRIEQANAYVPLALALMSLGVLWWVSTGLSGVKRWALLAVVAVDILGFGATFNPTIDPAEFEHVPPSVEFLRSDPSLYRVAVFLENDRLMPSVAQSQLAVSWALAYGIEDINGFNSLQPRRYTDFLFGPAMEDVSYGYLQDGDLVQAGNNVLSLLDVRYALVQPDSPVKPDPSWPLVYSDETVAIYQNPVSYGRAYFVDQVELATEPRTILDAVKSADFDPRRVAWVEGDLDELTAEQVGQMGRAEVSVERPTPNDLIIYTRTDNERFLVVSEMWFPGWEAELVGPDNKTSPLPVYQTNYLFRGLFVPAGEHTIHMCYRPTAFGAGLLISVLAAIGCAALLVITWRRQRANR